MTQRITNERLDRCEAVELFQKLSQEERIRVEGIIIGMTLARTEQGRTPGGERREGA